MANSIALAKVYTDLLDEVYKKSALTANLESDESLARAGANANEIVIPKISMDGLADYSRNSGYVNGDVTLTWETVKFNYERGRAFTVDDMDNEETQNIAFGKLAGEFIRTKVVPELDAFRFATYAAVTGAGTAAATLATGADVIAALRTATSAMDEAEVPMEDRHLFITPTLYGLVQDLDTNKSKEVLSRFASITQVPQTRFYSAIKLKDGTTPGEETGGYAKAEGAATQRHPARLTLISRLFISRQYCSSQSTQFRRLSDQSRIRMQMLGSMAIVTMDYAILTRTRPPESMSTKRISKRWSDG